MDQEVAEPLYHGGFSTYTSEGAWGSLQLASKDGTLEAIHRYPLDSFIHILDRVGSCLCGPHIVVSESNEGALVSVYTHNEWDLHDHRAGSDPVVPDILDALQAILDDAEGIEDPDSEQPS